MRSTTGLAVVRVGLSFGLGLGLLAACSSSGTTSSTDLGIGDLGSTDDLAQSTADLTPAPDLTPPPPDLLPRLGTINNPGTSCLNIKANGGNTGDGQYYIKSSTGAPLQVTCDMNTDDGGWTLLTPAVAMTLGAGGARAYLFRLGAAWYRSPTSQLVWDWNTSQELTGTWFYRDANVMTEKAYTCNGSAEKPGFGIGCSNGSGNNLKTLPLTTKDPANGTTTVCQDQPGIFPGLCTPNVSVLVR